MKRLMTFEKFTENDVNEWLGQKFLTGHGPGEKEQSKKKIESEIEQKISEIQSRINDDPDLIEQFPQFNNVESTKSLLLKKAEQNGYKGTIQIQKSPSGEIYIIYRDGLTALQSMGSAASGPSMGR